MKKYILFIVCIILPVIFASCDGELLSTGYLDTSPNTRLSIQEVFSDRGYTEHFLTSIYAQLPQPIISGQDRSPWTGISDEMEITFGGFLGHKMNHGAWGPLNVINIWPWYYQGIRKTNIFLENIDQVPLSEGFTQSDKDKWIGEVRFLRAYFHFVIFSVYGPIPIMDHTVPTNADFSKIKRAPVDSVVTFIVQELNKAAKLLPATRSKANLGRVTKVAARALKARVLLYAASPLFNGNPAYANFTRQDGTHLFPQQYDKTKWKKAALAARKAIEVAKANGFGLYNKYDDPKKNYMHLFLDDFNREVIWVQTKGRWKHLERSQSPLGYGGYSIMGVSQELVDAYRMSNGKNPITGYRDDGSPIINEASGYVETGYSDAGKYWPDHTRNMYVNREPRFYASVHFSGQMWKGRKIEMWYSGLDGHSKNASDFSETGYVMMKFSNPDINIAQNSGWDLKTRIHLRLGRLYLNYAEALNEWKGPVPEVYKYVNAIRNRAGLPNLPQGLSQNEMRKKIHHERRIELAFEGARYFDVRRWKLATKYLDGPMYGLSINKDRPGFWQRTVIDNRVFNSRAYLWPIPQGEINKMDIVQNPGW